MNLDSNSMNLEAKVHQFTNAKLYEQGYRFVSVVFKHEEYAKKYTYVVHPSFVEIREGDYCLVETSSGVKITHVVEIVEFPNLDIQYKPIFAVIPKDAKKVAQDRYDETVNEVKSAMRKRLFQNALKELEETTPTIKCTPEKVSDGDTEAPNKD